jgi:hypothetical protein
MVGAGPVGRVERADHPTGWDAGCAPRNLEVVYRESGTSGTRRADTESPRFERRARSSRREVNIPSTIPPIMPPISKVLRTVADGTAESTRRDTRRGDPCRSASSLANKMINKINKMIKMIDMMEVWSRGRGGGHDVHRVETRRASTDLPDLPDLPEDTPDGLWSGVVEAGCLEEGLGLRPVRSTGDGVGSQRPIDRLLEDRRLRIELSA